MIEYFMVFRKPISGCGRSDSAGEKTGSGGDTGLRWRRAQTLILTRKFEIIDFDIW
jgi:hypothetical protein